MYPPANFGQHHRANEFILDPYGLPLALDRLFGDAICERQRIYLSAAALIHALIEKHRVLVWRRGHVGGKHNMLDARPHRGGALHVAIAKSRASSAHAWAAVDIGNVHSVHVLYSR